MLLLAHDALGSSYTWYICYSDLFVFILTTRIFLYICEKKKKNGKQPAFFYFHRKSARVVVLLCITRAAELSQ